MRESTTGFLSLFGRHDGHQGGAVDLLVAGTLPLDLALGEALPVEAGVGVLELLDRKRGLAAAAAERHDESYECERYLQGGACFSTEGLRSGRRTTLRDLAPAYLRSAGGNGQADPVSLAA